MNPVAGASGISEGRAAGVNAAVREGVSEFRARADSGIGNVREMIGLRRPILFSPRVGAGRNHVYRVLLRKSRLPSSPRK